MEIKVGKWKPLTVTAWKPWERESFEGSMEHIQRDMWIRCFSPWFSEILRTLRSWEPGAMFERIKYGVWPSMGPWV